MVRTEEYALVDAHVDSRHVSHAIAPEVLFGSEVVTTPESNSRSSSGERVVIVFPFMAITLLIGLILVCLLSDISACSQPLFLWDSLLIGRNLVRSVLHDVRSRYWPASSSIPPRLALAIAFTELSGPALWSVGGYFIFHTDSCSQGVYAFSLVLWIGQTIGIILPCCFLSTLIFCLPLLVRLAPYLIRPNPNTVAAGQEAISKLRPVRYDDTGDISSSSCSICLNEYSPDDLVVKLPCGHIFHPTCIESWLNVSQLCPVDRSNVVDLLADKQADSIV
jgi:hypothetical protein